MTDLSIIVPVYQEAERVAAIVQDVAADMARHVPTVRYELLLVDDGSGDGTRDALARVVGGNVRGLALAENRGKAAAISAGLDAAHGEALMCTDSDLPHGFGIVPAALDALARGADVVNVARTRPPRHALVRAILSFAFGSAATHLSDPSSPTVLARASLVKQVCANGRWQGALKRAVLRHAHAVVEITAPCQPPVRASRYSLERRLLALAKAFGNIAFAVRSPVHYEELHPCPPK